MKQIGSLLPALLIVASTCLVSCEEIVKKTMNTAINSISHDYEDSDKWGKVVSIDLPALPFDEAELSGAVRLEYMQGNVYAISVYGNEKAIEAYTIGVDDHELNASLNDFNGKVSTSTPAITLRIMAPRLTEIQGTGASEVIFADSVGGDYGLDISLSGIGRVSLARLQLEELDIAISGGGKFDLEDVRCTNDVELRLEGAGGIKGRIECQKLDIKASGASEGQLDISTKKTKLSAFGSSNFILCGKTDSFTQRLSGSSTLQIDELEVSKDGD